jgi:prevent-host-death family protein
MERTIEIAESQLTIGEVIRDVVAKGDQIVVEQDGERVAAVVPVALYEQWQRSRKEFFDTMRVGAQRANMSPEEADELAAEAVQWARKNKDT